MAHGKQRFKANKQGNSKGYGRNLKSQRKFKSASRQSAPNDLVISKVLAKVTNRRTVPSWSKSSRKQESLGKGFSISGTQHQFEDMDTDDDQSETFSLPDTLDQHFEWTEGDANEHIISTEKSAPATFKTNNFSLGWGGALAYNSISINEQETPIHTLPDSISNGIQWTIDTQGSHGPVSDQVPEYETMTISDSDDSIRRQINNDNTEFARSSSFIKLTNVDNRSTRKLGRKKRKQAKRKGRRNPGDDGNGNSNETDQSDMEISLDYMQNVNDYTFNAEDHAFYTSGVEGGSPYLISSDSEGKSVDQIQNEITQRYQSDDHSSDDDLLFEGYNAWDVPDPEDQDMASHKKFKRVLKGSFDDVPVSLHNGLRARMRRQKNSSLTNYNAKAHSYDEASFSLSSNPHINLYQLDKAIRDFVSDTDRLSAQFPSMSHLSDQFLTTLASCYGFASQASTGMKNRYILLQRTHSTKIPKDRSAIDDFLARAQAELLTAPIQSRKHESNKTAKVRESQRIKRVRSKAKSGTKSVKQSTTSKKMADASKSKQFLSAPTHGTVVGREAAPINTSNVGHRMLAAMGWKEGDSLGTENRGIKTPIEAVVRRKRAGLGT